MLIIGSPRTGHITPSGGGDAKTLRRSHHIGILLWTTLARRARRLARAVRAQVACQVVAQVAPITRARLHDTHATTPRRRALPSLKEGDESPGRGEAYGEAGGGGGGGGGGA